jgi:hypothetical protein
VKKPGMIKGPVERGGTEKQRSARFKVFTDHKRLITELNCVHYCAVGGHLWYHTPPAENKLPDCSFRQTESLIKFFAICPNHSKQIKRRRKDYKRDDWYDEDF